MVFYLNLNFKYNVSVSPSHPYALSAYNNELYVGTNQGSILVVVSKTIIRSFTACSKLVSITTDVFGQMAVSCELDSVVKLFYYYGTYTGKNLTTPQSPMYIGFDSQDRFVLLSKYQISIYY
jgi:hypothetical protein